MLIRLLIVHTIAYIITVPGNIPHYGSGNINTSYTPIKYNQFNEMYLIDGKPVRIFLYAGYAGNSKINRDNFANIYNVIDHHITV